MRASLPAVAVLLLALMLGGCTLSSVDKREYTAKNEGLLRSVPVYPGARLESIDSIGDRSGNGWPAENSGPYTSFATYHGYTLPPATDPRQVLDFYESELPSGWHQYSRMPCEAGFRGNAGASLYVTTCYDRLSLSVDHATYDDQGRLRP
jgi:hypothetical protein